MSTTHKPCPFCGCTEVSIHEGSTFRWRYAGCDSCEARAGEIRIQTLLTEAERFKRQPVQREKWEAEARLSAMAAWNTRA